MHETTDGPDAGPRLPIGELARLAGTTTRAVRHYHAIGLLPEPERDASGYRRYGAAELVSLVRVVRLRALGMGTAAIAERVHPDNGGTSLREALVELSQEMQVEIDELTATRDRVLALAASEAFDQPVAAVTRALKGHGLLGQEDELGSAEEWLITLLDALTPSGLTGVLAQADGMLGDPAANDRLSALFEAFRRLDDHSSNAEIAQLASDVAAALPKRLRRRSAGPIDFAVVDRLLTDELSAAQLRFLQKLNARLRRAKSVTRARAARP